MKTARLLMFEEVYNLLIVIENFQDTRYKVRRIQCPKCGRTTQQKRTYAAAAREWNNPEQVHLN